MTSDPSTDASVDAGNSIRVLSRPGCHLCETLIEQLLPIVRDVADVEVVNINDDVALQQEYGTRIPVVMIGGVSVCEYFLDQAAVFAALDQQYDDS